MLALGSASLVASTFLREGGLRWVCACATVAFMILAIVSFVRASSEPD